MLDWLRKLIVTKVCIQCDLVETPVMGCGGRYLSYELCYDCSQNEEEPLLLVCYDSAEEL
jgi:hypothetical protein